MRENTIIIAVIAGAVALGGWLGVSYGHQLDLEAYGMEEPSSSSVIVVASEGGDR